MLYFSGKGCSEFPKNMHYCIGIFIVTMGIMFVCAYLLGTTQTETITKIQTVTETKDVIPDGYIPLDDSIVNMDAAVDFL